MTEWVEHGVAPVKIVATKFKDDEPTKGLMTRPLCPFPATLNGLEEEAQMTPLISFANSPDADPSMIQVGTGGFGGSFQLRRQATLDPLIMVDSKFPCGHFGGRHGTRF